MNSGSHEPTERATVSEGKDVSNPNYKSKKTRIAIISSVIAVVAATGIFVAVMVVPNLGPSDSAIKAAMNETGTVQNGVLLDNFVNGSPYEIISFEVSEKSYDADSNFGFATCSFKIENENFQSDILSEIGFIKYDEEWMIQWQHIISQTSTPLKGVDKDMNGNVVAGNVVFDEVSLTSVVTNEIDKENWVGSFSGAATETYRFSESTGWEFQEFSTDITCSPLINTSEEFTTDKPFNIDDTFTRMLSSGGTRDGASLRIISMTPDGENGLSGTIEVELSWSGTRQVEGTGDNYASLIRSRASGAATHEEFTESAIYSGEYFLVAESLLVTDYPQLGFFDVQSTSSDGGMPDTFSGIFLFDQTIECRSDNFTLTFDRINKI